jgi:hypothetical protein
MDNENNLQEQGNGVELETVTQGETPEKTFTQEQLNNIVEKRLSKERQRLMDAIKSEEAMKQELEQQKRVTNTQKRLVTEGYPIEVSELIDFTDDDTCAKSYDKVIDILTRITEQKVNERFKGYGRNPHKGGVDVAYSNETSALRGAFGLNRGD